MAMRRCRNGHFYDDGKHSQCPYCGVGGVDLKMVGRSVGTVGAQPTVAKTPGGHPGKAEVPRKNILSQTEAPPKAHMTPLKAAVVPVEEGKTVGLMRGEKGFDPVVGWLVCIDGPEKGKDYRLQSEKNFIGRASKLDVAIVGDDGISTQNHAIISYKPKNNTFKVMPGESRGLVYLNEEEVLAPMDMKDRDILELGKTKLMFVALCGNGFVW